MIKDFLEILLKNIWLVIPVTALIVSDNMTKLITVFAILHNKNISDEKVKAITKMMSHNIIIFKKKD